MIKLLGNRSVLLCGLLPNIVMEEVSLDEYKKLRGLHLDDPWERVKMIFSRDDHGNLHPEMKYATHMFQLGLVVGGTYGGALNSFGKSESYIRQNESRVFANQREAMSAFVNHNTLTFCKGAIRWAPVFGIFCGCFSLVSSCCEAYRNKPHIIDSSVAGFVVGGLSRFMFGIKGFISGAVVGGTLGTVYGVILWSLSKLSNADLIELKHAQFAYSQYRKQANAHSTSSKQEEDEIIEKMGLHSRHVVNPLKELDSDKKQPVNNSTENKNK